MHSPARTALWLAALALFAGSAEAQPTFLFSAADATISYDIGTGGGTGTVSLFNEQVSGAIANVNGWSLGLGHDPAILDATAIAEGAYIASLNGGNGPAFWSAVHSHPNGITIGCVYSLVPPIAVCTYEIPKEVAVITYQTIPGALIGDLDGLTTALTFSNTIGTPPVVTVVVVGGTSIPAGTDGGTVTLLPETAIVRGDANGDGSVDAVADALFAGDYLFGGGPVPPCIDAIDVDDDGVADVADLVRLLMWGYSAGPAPPAPFPGCGSDPTPDAFSCDTPAC